MLSLSQSIQAMIWGSDRWYIEFYRTCEGVPADAWREGCTSCIEDEIPPDDLYIRMEPVLAQNDYNDIMMQLRSEPYI